MKKFLAALTTALAVVVLALTLTACSNKSGSIKKAFESEGYTVTAVSGNDSKELKELLSEEQQKNAEKYEVITCKKGLVHNALIFVFPSKDDLVEALGQDTYDSMVESGMINGNCYLVFTIDTEVIEIFKKA
ncbi:MAG: hypothetical protein K2O67_06615 [Clostridia bacterium]|nr:hypothetical protein [Clostridia bacterium]